MNQKSHQNDDKTGQSLLISTDDLAVLIGVSTRTIWRLLSAGKIIEPVRFGGTVRWNRAQIQEWIEQGCPSP